MYPSREIKRMNQTLPTVPAGTLSRRASTNEWTTHSAAASSSVTVLLATGVDGTNTRTTRQTDRQTGEKRKDDRTVCDRDVPHATPGQMLNICRRIMRTSISSVAVSFSCFAYRNCERLSDSENFLINDRTKQRPGPPPPQCGICMTKQSNMLNINLQTPICNYLKSSENVHNFEL